jgi:predicted phage-related endonuclease
VWKRIPEADASESAAKALQLLYPEHVPLSTTDLSEDEQANQQFEQLIQTRNQIEKHQEQFDLLKHQLQAKMQEAERAFKAGSVTWKKSKDSISLDIKSLLQHQPELIQQYPLQKAGSRRFNIYHD